MIATVTLNPSWDRILTVPAFRFGVDYDQVQSHEYPGGKGINVSRWLTGFKLDNRAFFLAGGDVGLRIEQQLDKEQIAVACARIQSETRSNVTLFDPEKKSLSHIRQPGASVRKVEFKMFMDIFMKNLGRVKGLVLAGSVSPGLVEDVYAQMIKRYRGAHQAPIFLDTHGNALRLALKEKPDVLKINIKELESLLSTSIRGRKALHRAVQALHEKGVPVVCVTKDASGALLSQAGQIWEAKALSNIIAVNTVGCGDAFLAGLVYASCGRSWNWGKALQFSIATAGIHAKTLYPELISVRKSLQLAKAVRLSIYS